MAMTDDDKVLEVEIARLREENRILRSQETRGREMRQYDMMLEVTAALNRVAPTIERQSRDAAAQARALYDLLPMIETKHDYLINQNRVHIVDMQQRIEKFLEGAAKDREAIVNHIIAIRTATAIASNDAGDAKNAANAARDATGQHKKDGDEGNKGTVPETVKAMGGALKGLPFRSQVLFMIMVLAACAALAFKSGEWSASHDEPARVEEVAPIPDPQPDLPKPDPKL